MLFLLYSHEMYTNPRNALFVTLVRTFLMEGVVIGVVVAFWLKQKKSSEVNIEIEANNHNLILNLCIKLTH